jgi:hypothetical protein
MLEAVPMFVAEYGDLFLLKLTILVVVVIGVGVVIKAGSKASPSRMRDKAV